MVKAGKLINAVSGAYRLPEGKIALSGRMLRERGLLTTGAHGVNAPDMTFLDAARLMLGYLFLDKPSLMPDAVRVFGSLWGEASPEREVFEGFPRRFSSIDVGEPEDIPASMHIPNVNFLAELPLEKNTFEFAFAKVLEELSKPENLPFYERLGIKIGADAHQGVCWIFIPGWEYGWQYSARQTKHNEMLAAMLPKTDDAAIEAYRPNDRRQFSVDNLIYELLSSYPAIHVERSIDFPILAEVASVFSGSAESSSEGAPPRSRVFNQPGPLGPDLKDIMSKWGDKPLEQMTRGDFERLLQEVRAEKGSSDVE